MKISDTHLSFDLPTDLSMYDKLPYVPNRDVINSKNVKLVSGNIIKRYNVKQSEEQFIIDPLNYDDNVIDSIGKEISKDKNTINDVNINEDIIASDLTDNTAASDINNDITTDTTNNIAES